MIIIDNIQFAGIRIGTAERAVNRPTRLNIFAQAQVKKYKRVLTTRPFYAIIKKNERGKSL